MRHTIKERFIGLVWSCLVLLSLSQPAQAVISQTRPLNEAPIKVVFISVDIKYWFWEYLLDVLKEAAEDLNIDLEVLGAERDHIRYKETALNVLKRAIPPDYLIIGNEKESAAAIIEASNTSRTKVFLINNGFVSKRNSSKFAETSPTYPQWIGQVIPDNFHAGYESGKALLQEAHKAFPSTTIQMLAFSGAHNTHASNERVRGLHSAIAESKAIDLLQTVSADWNGTLAEKKAVALLGRYQVVHAIWSANDEMAIGTLHGAVRAGYVPGKNLFISSTGWSKPAVEEVSKGTLVASLGGHFLDSAWALAMIYDRQHGEKGLNMNEHSKFIRMDASNVSVLGRFMKERLWHQFDFKQWTHVHNPHLTSYETEQRKLIFASVRQDKKLRK